MQSLALITSHAPSLIQFRAQMIRELIKRNVQVFAIAPNYEDEIRNEVKSLGAIPIDCPIERAGMNPIRDLINTWKLMRLLRRLKPDISLGYFIKPVIFGSFASFFAGVPRRFAMVEGLGFVFIQNEMRWSYKRIVLKWMVLFLYKLSFSCVRKVIFLNPDDKLELERVGILPSYKSFILGGIGVDLDIWKDEAKIQESPNFLMVARLLHEKGVSDFVDAARIIKRKYRHARFVLLGGFDDNPGAIQRANLEAWISEGLIEWYGHVPVKAWLSQSSVFVLPSYREGVPVSTQEALAMGRAVITTDVAGCRETVTHGVNGFLVPVRDSRALAEKMEFFIKNPEMITKMGRESRNIAENRFDIHKVSLRLVNLLLD